MIQFRQKDFGVLSSTIQGAKLGGLIGTAATLMPNKFRPKLGVAKGWEGNVALSGGGMLVGAALGFLAGITAEGFKKANQATTVDNRLMKVVVENLKKSNLQEGKDFTRDPKVANDLKTKVCILMTKVSNDLEIHVNTASDSKLKTLATGMLKNIPNTATVTKKLSDKFNDITISTISDSSADAGLITGIAEYFIHSGYPVYLVEVG